ncbi:histidine kinase [Marinomonas ushuaiensis DSM 15871]|uniref:histidine kinase n=1 Tax=Marinomonas ushuaiensis DSM 15871 TaxID=1122207 RepID=X7E253_9GAMM|nr:HAMP domain-containing sensor histidine kinase [Marinomonas ushuaiensis]ETX09920.1 histidine kinase [Marinomonas ushuaiensis DSM 15871]
MLIKSLLRSSSFRQAAIVAFISLLISSASIVVCDYILDNIMKSHVRSMIFENLEDQELIRLLNNNEALISKLDSDASADNRKDHFTFLLNASGKLLYGNKNNLTDEHLATLNSKRTNPPSIITLKNDNIELLGLLIPLANGSLYFNAYNIRPMILQTRIIPLMTGAGLLAIQLSILLISLPFSLHNLYRVNHIIETLEKYTNGKHKVRVSYKNNGDEFGQLSKEINQVLARTEKLMEEVRSITSHVAHELRTPLTRLQHRLINISERVENEELIELELAIKESEQIQMLFRSIMRLSEVETERVSLQKDKINAYEILYEAYEYYQPLAESKGIEIKLEVNRKLSFYADRILIFQAIANLLDNAIKYAPESRTITLGIESTQSATLIKIADQGKGIPEESKLFVTQRFKRLASKTEIFGHGLGLTLVHAIASLHNGDLDLINTHPGLCVCLKICPNKTINQND